MFGTLTYSVLSPLSISQVYYMEEIYTFYDLPVSPDSDLVIGGL